MFNTESGKVNRLFCFSFSKGPEITVICILISLPRFSSCFHTVNLTAVYLFLLEHLPSNRSANSKIVCIFYSISSVQKFRFWPPAHQDVYISQTSLGEIAFCKNILHFGQSCLEHKALVCWRRPQQSYIFRQQRDLHGFAQGE